MRIVEINFDGGYDFFKRSATWGYHMRWGRNTTAGMGHIADERMTVHIAEYLALLKAIRRFKKEEPKWKEFVFMIYGDSMLVVQHVGKRWGTEKSKSGKTVYGWNPHKDNPHLRIMLDKILRELDGVEYQTSWVRRDRNKIADRFTNVAKKGKMSTGK